MKIWLKCDLVVDADDDGVTHEEVLKGIEQQLVGLTLVKTKSGSAVLDEVEFLGQGE